MNHSDFNLTYQTLNTDSKIVAALERIAQAFRVLLWQESKTFSLTPIQVQVLIFLRFHQREQCKVSYLADEFNMTKATISDAVKTLEQKNLVKKTAEPHDTRSFVIQLTPQGKKIADKTSLFSKEIAQPVQQLPASEQATLLLQLLNIIGHLNQTGIITIQRMCLNCRFYKPEGNTQHYCQLLNRPLHVSDLRIDCPEYGQTETV